MNEDIGEDDPDLLELAEEFDIDADIEPDVDETNYDPYAGQDTPFYDDLVEGGHYDDGE